MAESSGGAQNCAFCVAGFLALSLVPGSRSRRDRCSDHQPTDGTYLSTAHRKVDRNGSCPGFSVEPPALSRMARLGGREQGPPRQAPAGPLLNARVRGRRPEEAAGRSWVGEAAVLAAAVGRRR
ncbi:hypothetical protein LZ31DRAFT_203413 [Colletotrichum somersetense]|nr:hypothetical protein LZ31DRAFT_203413 [Colletotrichum somersetense]